MTACYMKNTFINKMSCLIDEKCKKQCIKILAPDNENKRTDIEFNKKKHGNIERTVITL